MLRFTRYRSPHRTRKAVRRNSEKQVNSPVACLRITVSVSSAVKSLRKCKKCNIYTLKETCPKCGSRTFDPKPPKFSPQDRYGRYRREMKRMERYKNHEVKEC
ncbi:MAG: RNA-protein complex protein Nop10 [Candidatus Aenigmatarchaeota archaeon]|nr:MAG: RNA-protein complex protein Nop10 [Candidatus Aenigmarchaeota archaeon]